MTSILIVDDEHFVRMGIRSSLDWEKYGYVVAGEAENGIEALEKIRSLNPDIVFLDITMPEKNGLDTLSEARQEGYRGYIAMLTCHEDFRLIQKAMRIGADDYVLKNEMTGERMLEYLEKIPRERKHEGADLEEALENAKEQAFFKLNFLNNLLKIGGIDKSQFLQVHKRYGIRIKCDGIYMILFEIKRFEAVKMRYQNQDSRILLNSVDNLVGESLKGYPEHENFWIGDSYVVLLTFSHEPSQMKTENEVRGIVNRICFQMENFLDLDLAVAVNRGHGDISEINRLFEETQLILSQSFFQPDKSQFWFQDQWKTAEACELEARLEAAGGEGDLLSVVKEYVVSCRKERLLIDRERFGYLLSSAVSIREREYKLDSRFHFEECESIAMVYNKLEELDGEIETAKNAGSHSHLIHQAIDLVTENLSREIMLEGVAEKLGVSPSYFSRVFSKEMNQTFSSYIIGKRIEKAKNLILTTNLKFYEIAEMCGFHSPVHFNNMFKKVCGMTPNQFRNDREVKKV